MGLGCGFFSVGIFSNNLFLHSLPEESYSGC
nr:MAG TPA: hypothetical protein [Caudoviricetes sp.]